MISGNNALVPPARDKLLRALTVPLRGSLHRYCGDDDVTPDLLQETLIRIDGALPGFDGRSNVKTWAFTIATRTAADHFRKAARQLPTAEDADATDTIADDHTLEQQLDGRLAQHLFTLALLEARDEVFRVCFSR